AATTGGNVRASHAARSGPTDAANVRHARCPCGDSRFVPPAARHIASTASSSNADGTSSWFAIDIASGTTRTRMLQRAGRPLRWNRVSRRTGSRTPIVGTATSDASEQDVAADEDAPGRADRVRREVTAVRRVARLLRGVEETPPVDGLLEHHPTLRAEGGVEVEAVERQLRGDPTLERRELARGEVGPVRPVERAVGVALRRHQVDEGAGVLAEQRRVEEDDEVGAGGR